MLIFPLALVCAATIGFAAHRASLCNVRAVAEVMHQGSAHMLGGLAQAILWASLVAGVAIVLGGHAPPSVRMPAAIAWSLSGGWLFGIGAAANGGCSLSTLHRLADGEFGMLATLLGLAIGVSLDITLGPLTASLREIEWVTVAPVWLRWPVLARWLLMALSVWAVWRVLALRQLTWTPSPSTGRARTRREGYPHAVTAALIGICGGVLYVTQGAWSYTNHLRNSVLHAWTGSPMLSVVGINRPPGVGIFRPLGRAPWGVSKHPLDRPILQ